MSARSSVVLDELPYHYVDDHTNNYPDNHVEGDRYPGKHLNEKSTGWTPDQDGVESSCKHGGHCGHVECEVITGWRRMLCGKGGSLNYVLHNEYETHHVDDYIAEGGGIGVVAPIATRAEGARFVRVVRLAVVAQAHD